MILLRKGCGRLLGLGSAGAVAPATRGQECPRHILVLRVRPRWAEFVAEFQRRVERGVEHPQWAEDFALAENVERFSGDAFESCAQHDESDVAVLGVRAGIGREGSGEGGSQQVFARARFEEQLLVGGQAGGVGEEHAEGDVAAARIGFAAGVGHEFGDDADYGGFQFEQAALVEDCVAVVVATTVGQGSEVEESRGRDVLFSAFNVKIPTLSQERDKDGAPSALVS